MVKTQPKTGDAKAGELEAANRQLLAGDFESQMPDFLREAPADGSMDLLKQYVVPPRIKIVQGQAKAPFNELFKPGNLCAVPMLRPVWDAEFDPRDRDKNVAFHFVPVFFFPEWVTWNPYGTDLTPVRARSFDPQSDIAVKSRDPARRKEPCQERPLLPDGKPAFVSHLEHLNYVLLILPPNELAEVPILLSFASGEHRAGTNFNALLRQRKAKHLYGCQFAARVSRRTNKLGTWFGVDVDNPAPGSGVTPFVMDKERFDALALVNAEFREYYGKQQLRPEYDDQSTVEAAAVRERAEYESEPEPATTGTSA